MIQRKVYSVDMSFLVATDSDVSPSELEEGIESAIQSVPGLCAYNCPHLLIQPAGDRAFCCPICGSEIEQEVHVKGVFKATVGMATGMAEGGNFDGDQTSIYVCSSNSSHELPPEFEELLRNAVEISLDAFE